MIRNTTDSCGIKDGEADRRPDMYQWVRLSFGNKPAPNLAINANNLLADRAQVESPGS
jgi:hypothetical protein